jgi:hypothetical protein
MPRARGSKNRQTVERETAKKIAAARAELVKNAPPLDFSMPLDGLDMMEHIIRHFYFRAKIAERLGDRVDRRRANAAFMQAVRAAEKSRPEVLRAPSTTNTAPGPGASGQSRACRRAPSPRRQDRSGRCYIAAADCAAAPAF